MQKIAITALEVGNPGVSIRRLFDYFCQKASDMLANGSKRTGTSHGPTICGLSIDCRRALPPKAPDSSVCFDLSKILVRADAALLT